MDRPAGRGTCRQRCPQGVGGIAAAQRAGLNTLARIHQALDGFDRLVGLLHVAGHVGADDSFLDIPKVLDGASDLLSL